MRKIIYTKVDGTVAVVTPVRNSRGDEGLSDEAIEQRALAMIPKDAITPTFVDPSVIPSERKYRSAWRQEGGLIRVDASVSAAIDAALDKADLNNASRALKALGLLIAQYTGKTPAQVRSDFMAIYKSL
jgi:hypothetical protein